MELFLLYLAAVSTKIVYLSAVFSVILLSVPIVVWANLLEEPRLVKRCLKIGLTLLLVAVLVPTEKQLYKIAIGYYAINSEEATKLPDNFIKAGNKFLEDYLKKE